MRTLTNRQAVILSVLRDRGEATVNEIVDSVRSSTPCATCGGSGAGDDGRYGCRPCYGRGHVPFSYSDAYPALKRLLNLGLITRRKLLDQFGDETPTWVWKAVAEQDSGLVDELEALFRLPAAEVRS